MNANQCKANGGNWKDNKCVIPKQRHVRVIYFKDTPFAKIGSWIGAIIAGALLLMIKCQHLGGNGVMAGTVCSFEPIITLEHIQNLLSHPAGPFYILLAIFAVGITLGFLAGWGVETLVRKKWK